MKNINSGTVDALQPGWSDTYLREAWTLFGNIHDHGKLWVLLSDYFETYEQSIAVANSVAVVAVVAVLLLLLLLLLLLMTHVVCVTFSLLDTAGCICWGKRTKYQPCSHPPMPIPTPKLGGSNEPAATAATAE
jgi:hypothetical protein